MSTPYKRRDPMTQTKRRSQASFSARKHRPLIRTDTALSEQLRTETTCPPTETRYGDEQDDNDDGKVMDLPH